jgi:hypothetical protein
MSGINQPRQPSNELAVVAGVIVAAGLVAAFGWMIHTNHVNQVYAGSQDKAVFSRLELLQFAADQYFEKNGVSSVASSALIGTNSTDLISPFQSVAQETYTSVIIKGHGISAMGIAGARTVTFGP